MVSNVIQIAGGKLKRELNLVTLVAIMIGLNIGGSLFVLTAIAAGLTGPSLFISQLISSLPILLALIPLPSALTERVGQVGTATATFTKCSSTGRRSPTPSIAT